MTTGAQLRELLEREGVATRLGLDPQLYTIVKLRVIGARSNSSASTFENQPDHEVLATMLDDYEAALPVTTRCCSPTTQGWPDAHPAHGSNLARTRASGAGRPEGQRLREIRRRHRDHAEPCRARTSDRPVAGRSRLAPARRAPAPGTAVDGLLLTRSRKACPCSTHAGHSRVPAQAREVFDVTGAAIPSSRRWRPCSPAVSACAKRLPIANAAAASPSASSAPRVSLSGSCSNEYQNHRHRRGRLHRQQSGRGLNAMASTT